ncbi:MAG: nitroreductase family protein, partial [Bacteroidales bacterium]|nr:nitroreductase family protein [Bacteroidales bacterium]
MKKFFVMWLVGILSMSAACAAETAPAIIELPKPSTDGMSLMQALKQRQSVREYADREIAPQDLSNLLWAAFGVNRPEEGKRTAPSG